jgi:uncharacterized protein (DUF885 family)
MRRASVFFALSCAVLIGCQREENAAAPTGENAAASWAATRDALIEEYLRAQPAFAVYQGRHEFDGQLPDWSADGIAAQIKRLRAARARAAGMSGLAGVDAFERDYLVSQFDDDLFFLEDAQFPFMNPAYYIGALDPSVYLTREYAPLEQRLRAYISYARAVQRAAGQIRANLRLPLARTVLERGVSGFSGYADFFRSDVPKVFAGVTDAALQKEFAGVNEGAAKAMADLAEWLKSQSGTATESFALGAERFARMLKATEGVTTPLAEIEAAGRAELKRDQQALRDACATFAPGATVQACMAKMQDNKPQGGAVAGARAQLDMLKQFVQDAGVVTIPGPEQALVAESPPYNRANSAYIDIPGPYEKQLPSIYYIAPPDPAWTAEERRAYIPGKADLLFTSVHEVWPGHFLQFLHANRTKSLVGRLFVGYAFAEGWALYVEELMWDLGLGKGDAETHVGQLMNSLYRTVRLLSAIGLHTKGMTVAESERLFREDGFLDPANARQQAARGTYDPAYLNYTMGKLMIRKLRDDWSAPRGGRKAWREFHDTFLTFGGPPIPMVRQQMLGSGGSVF